MPAVTNKVPGNGTNSLSYTIPGAGLDVEAVRVVVDASGAGGPVTAEVKITDQSGVVIATKPQGQTIDAGGAGSATWALRLDDEQAAGGEDPTAVHYDTNTETGTFLRVETTGGSVTDGITLKESGSGGIYLQAAGGGTGGYLQVAAGQQLDMSGDPVTLTTNTTVQVNLDDSGSQFRVLSPSAQTMLQLREGSASFYFIIADGAGNALFKIDRDGTIHGLASVGAITWDL